MPDQSLFPASLPSRSKWKFIGIGCGGPALVVIALAILGAIVGPPKKNTHTASTATSAVPQSSSTRVAKPSSTHHSTRAASGPTTPAPRVHPTTAPSPRPELDLVFSGGLEGHITRTYRRLPRKTGAHYDYVPPAWSTQCVMPTQDGAWHANVSFQLDGTTWTVDIGQPGFGYPKPGSHPGVDETSTSFVDGSVSLMVSSDKSPGAPASAGASEYTYYTPMNHNDGKGTVKINRGLTSGSIDVWLTPSAPDPLNFRLKGRWAC
ncbi:hypothetical protein [Streptomyces sp. UNOB3_S3]|uniref:hypothetical protein n=1 Tax=Streptomyces sp. UNOB3_S3 TaxID=2871682 RepID=UPI001E54BED1|nr:hypothetical protein [Streptomyces sp. UNOB3_S3]MCC3775809.1 hypothetical protein [Streptomyces sp. UNOB3_S3]